MKIGILSIGDELLLGAVQDSNTHHIARILFKEGMKPCSFRTCSDLEIEKTLREMLQECQIVITSGGLGPTHDDLTAASVAKVIGVEMKENEEVMRDLMYRFPNQMDEVEAMSRIPHTAEPLMNFLGSAPGFFVFDRSGRTVISFPGVPYELEAMAEEYLPYVIQKIRKDAIEGIYSRTMHFCHAKEDQIAPIVSILGLTFPEFVFGIYPKIGSVSVSFQARAADAATFLSLTEEIVQILYEKFPTLVFPSKSGSVVEAVLDELRTRKETLALAESCTGGDMAASLTKLSGASEVLRMAVVAYSNESKHKILGVSDKTLKTRGAVSQEVVIEMIEGAFALSDADYAVAVSGIAGPNGGSLETPVGTVWKKITKRSEKIKTGLIPHKSTMRRDVIIHRSTNYLYGALWRYLAYEICPFT